MKPLLVIVCVDVCSSDVIASSSRPAPIAHSGVPSSIAERNDVINSWESIAHDADALIEAVDGILLPLMNDVEVRLYEFVRVSRLAT